MMRSASLSRLVFVLSLLVLFVCSAFTLAKAQSVPQPSTAANPANDCGCPKRDDPIPVSSGMVTPFLPRIPNLEFGFLYSFGRNVRTGRFTADYLLPINLSADSVLFGEAHAEGSDFWKRPNVSITTPTGFTTSTSTANNRVDLSFGGGYRTMLGDNTFLGVNGFYDTSRLYNRWYSSGGVGLEAAYYVGGEDAVDLNFNWYGNLFNRDILINAFRNKGNSFDLEAGYSHALFDHSLDLRLKFAGYQFDVGNRVYGWRTGADLTTKNGMFTLRYEYGNDRINGQYNTVGGFLNLGFQMENILRGESPFTMPEPVFRSPRNLRRLLSQKVRRNWHQPTAVVQTRTGAFGLAGGPGCDRFLASITMAPIGLGTGIYSSAPLYAPFPLFPYTSLDPTKFIVVELDYSFDATPPPVLRWLVGVYSLPVPRVNVFGSLPVVMPLPPSNSGHLSFTLNTVGPQLAFTNPPGQDPNQIYLQIQDAAGTTSLQITNVCIRFNQ
jgi:hypothetical protein